MTDAETQVYNYIKKHKPAKQVNIVDGTALDVGTVSRAVKNLEKLGKIDHFPARYEVRL